MKSLRKPTREQKVIMQREKLSGGNWMVERNTSTELVFVNSVSGKRHSVTK